MTPILEWEFSLPGELKPKGSMRPFTYKGKDGKQHASAAHRKGAHESQAVVQLAAEEHLAARPDLGRKVGVYYRNPVAVVLVTYFDPPQWVANRRKATARRPGYERRHLTRPDLDKLLRTVLDGLTAVAFKDDAQVFHLEALKKYAPDGARAGSRVEIAYFDSEYEVPA